MGNQSKKYLPLIFAPVICLAPVIVQAQAQTQSQSQTPAQPQAQALSPIVTDRPTFSDGTALIPQGHWQLETGASATTMSGSTNYTYGEVIARYGLSSRYELRLANVTWAHVPGQSNGLLDPLVGFKIWIQTGSLKRPDLSAELVTSAPIGAAQFRVNRSQPTAKLLYNQQFDANTALNANLIVSDLGPSGSRFTQWAESAALSRTITSKLGLFAEIYRIDPLTYAGQGSTFYDVGATYLLNNDLQLDARFGSGFDSQSNGSTFGVGISYRH